MFDTLFGAEMPLAIRFSLVFLIVLGLIGAAAWAIRRFSAARLRGTSSRGRQPRLAVIDSVSVDGRRRLITVRRDNVEHLLMIGGPTDVVVESNIVRAGAAPHEVPVATRPGVPRKGPPTVAKPHPAEPRPELRPESRAEHGPKPRVEPRPEPRIATPQLAAAQPAAAETAARTDKSLTDIAHRLEAALRKPDAAPSAEQAPAAKAVATSPSPVRTRRPSESMPPRADAKPNQSKRLYESLEQETARLLGRPTKN